MKTSGLFRLHSYKINGKYGEPIRLVFFGDVHRDSPNHADAHWQNFLRYSAKLKGAYFFGVGDYLDSTSSSERDCLEQANSRMHETTKWDLSRVTDAKICLLARELKFMEGRLIGLMNGNHYFQYDTGINSDQKLCEKLKCAYLGVSTFVRLTIECDNCRQNFDIWAHHGAGGARLPGGSINRVDQMREHADADAFVQGHDHKRGVIPATPKMRLCHDKTGLRLVEKQQWLLRTGSFLKSYEDGKVSYNVDAARGPCSLGHVELEITPQRSWEGKSRSTRLDIRGIA